ncbi:hypothetical protein DPMN_099277 [Dreissena polymorpha]|uniref:Uncharacterized protein n=1 Tax=Dreissena polymorpha TaxID=45954 RepID=A0A9D4LF67_DREPO|nr:hypothetical protein DPMN_099277 [Dreissena polymorpha]
MGAELIIQSTTSDSEDNMPSSDDSFTESLTDVPDLSLDDGVETLIKARDSSTKDTNENEAQKMFLGIFDVHIENLIPPSPKRASRLLDLEHVKFLMDSFQSGVFQQLTILVGMVPDDCDPSILKMKDSALLPDTRVSKFGEF